MKAVRIANKKSHPRKAALIKLGLLIGMILVDSLTGLFVHAKPDTNEHRKATIMKHM